MERLFGIQTCPAWGGGVRIIARIENSEVVKNVLTHLNTKKG
ncbi:MAG: hypothetical protein QNJ87_03755 [Gammaproteobacteria bacterium]|nr:hypothetical protein [Gammaproteobacteria bacterium]